MAIITSIVAAGLLFAVYQPGDAATYTAADGSVSKYMSKVAVEPYKGKGGWWYYSVKVCATDYTMGVAGVILKSDLDTQVLGINKNIPKGECRTYGAVMKANDGKTLGGELIQKSDAIKRMLDLKNSVGKTKAQKNAAAQEWGMLYNMVRLNPH